MTSGFFTLMVHHNLSRLKSLVSSCGLELLMPWVSVRGVQFCQVRHADYSFSH